MDEKSILEQITTILFGAETETTKVEVEKAPEEEVVVDEKKFVEAKSGDLVLTTDSEDFIVDAKVMIVTPEGNIDPEDSDYILDDGRILTIKGGIITEVRDLGLEPTEEQTPVEAEPELMSKNEIVELRSEIAELKSKINEITEINVKIAEFSKELETKLNAVVENTPAETVIKNFNKIKDDDTHSTNDVNEIIKMRSRK